MRGDLAIVECTDNDLDQLALMNKQLIEDEKHDNPMNVDQLRVRMRDFLHTDYKAYIFVAGDGVVSISRSCSGTKRDTDFGSRLVSKKEAYI